MAAPTDKSNLSPLAVMIALIAALGFVGPGKKSGEDKPAPAIRSSSPVSPSGKVYEHGAEDLILDFMDADADEVPHKDWSGGRVDAPDCAKGGDVGEMMTVIHAEGIL